MLVYTVSKFSQTNFRRATLDCSAHCSEFASPFAIRVQNRCIYPWSGISFEGITLDRSFGLQCILAVTSFALLTSYFVSSFTSIPVSQSDGNFPTKKVSMRGGTEYKAVAYFVNW